MQKKTWQHILSMILVLTLLVSSVPMQVYAVIGDALAYTLQLDADDTAALEKVLLDTQYVVAEDESKRSECSKEFVLNNGLRLATIYSSPIHYEEDGKWKDIDNTLITTISDGSAFYTNTSGKWDVLFPQSLSGSNMICISKDGFTVRFGMAGELRSTGDLVVASVGQIEDENIASTLTVSSAQTAIAEVQQLDLSAAHAAAEYPETVLETLNSRLTYEGIYPNTNVVYDLKGNQLKESIVLQQFDSTLWGYRYIFDTGDLVPVLNEDQQIDLCNPDTGDVVLTMPAPYMLDNNGEYSYDVEVSLVRNGSNYLLSYYLPMDWLAEETRAWPVILDPVIEHPGRFNYISDRTVFDNGTHAYDHGALYCGKTNLGAARIFLQYNSLPELTSADIVVEASISLLCASSSTYEQVIEVHKVKNAWTSQTITWGEQPEYIKTIEDYVICNGPGRYTWSITDIVREWYAGTNTGMMFKTSESVETSQEVKCKQFFSSDYSLLAEELPMLSIKIRNANGLEGYWDYTSSSASRAGVGYVNNYNGNLVWVCSDIDFGGNRMPVAISHVYNANDSMKNEFGMGYGWRTNYNQRVYQWELDDSYYVWEDSDGTLHYFYAAVDQNGVAVNNTYIDEDGLYLTLEVIGTGASATYQLSDKYGNISHFDTKGRLVKIENNQQTKSNISITYTTATSNLISKITDGVNRAYYFTYTNNLLSRISYKSTGSSEITYVAYSYTGDRLTSITDKSGTKATYTYGDRNLLLTAQDANEYQVAYTYNLIDTTAEIQPSRIKTITELDCSIDPDDPILGSQISIEYANNQTAFTDHNGNVMIMQFNNWGNTVAVMDGEGHGQFATYKPADNPTDIGNQLTLSSKLQNTVANMLADTSFEQSTLWSSFSTAVTQSISTTEAYYGNKSLKITRASAGSESGVYKSVSVTAGESYTFSAYVKTSGTATAYLSIVDSSNNIKTSETLDKNSNWTRLEVSYTATTSGTIKIQLMTETAGTIYMDCVQLENAPTASRYNLVNNGNFRTTGYWTSSSNAGTNIQHVTEPTFNNNNTKLDVPHLDDYAYQFTGNPQEELYLMQTIAISGSKDDVFVLAGWAQGNSVALSDDEEEGDDTARAFCIRGVFTYADGSTSEKEFSFSFNPDVGNWQYTAGVMVAPEDYTGIEVYLVYNYNANTVYFDGIQLYKEEFGYLYTYDDRGNIAQVRDLQGETTTYTYASTTDDLTEIVYPDGTVTTYTYDAYHNVKTVTSDEGVVYTYTYDTYGNNVSVAVGSGNSVLTSTATYTSDGNRLSKTTDTAGNVTTYSYNADTNVLEWVQYPDNEETQMTTYTYDQMYRMTGSSVVVNGTTAMSATYIYSNDLLTKLQTGSTLYEFSYTDFGLCSEILIGTRRLASYTYNTQDHCLTRLDYGNGDDVEYAYDDVGRVTSQTYENGDTITFAYDNNGALATVWDSATGRTTTYYYDTTNRLIRYLETDDSDYEHSVSYGYNEFNLLSSLKETINGATRTTNYAYDNDYRISSVTSGSNVFTYGYDADNGRLTGVTFRVAGSALYTRGYTYYGADTEMANHIQTLSYSALGYSYTYEYDEKGNITAVSDGTNTTRYTYDAAGQLLQEDNQAAGKTWVWAYDNAGNILSRTEYAYTTGALGAALGTISYTYGDTNWGDLLTAYDETAITYDDSGNRLSDGTWTYTWEHGRQLATMTDGSQNLQYTYDANGMRTSKVSQCEVLSIASRRFTTTTHDYVYLGGRLVQDTITITVATTVYDPGITPYALTPGTTTTTTTRTLYFCYDASGNPASVSYTDNSGNTTEYYYVTNLQGDVVAIVNSAGATVVQYTYGAWGKPLTTTGSMSGTLGVYNPLRYRGYVYDTETGLYYLQSRYYDPAVGRFINADVYVSTGQGILGCNMFAYCNNNPVNNSDPSGYLTDGQIHDAVLQKIVERSGYRYKYKRTDTLIIYPTILKGKYFGFCDLYDPNTGEVWELKKNTSSTTCRTEYAQMQLGNYISGYLVSNPGLELKYPQTSILGGYFTLTDFWGNKYIISYWDQGGGILRYQYYVVPPAYAVVGVVVVAGMYAASIMLQHNSAEFSYCYF